jgi:hypothetical protein
MASLLWLLLSIWVLYGISLSRFTDSIWNLFSQTFFALVCWSSRAMHKHQCYEIWQWYGNLAILENWIVVFRSQYFILLLNGLLNGRFPVCASTQEYRRLYNKLRCDVFLHHYHNNKSWQEYAYYIIHLVCISFI